jgi:hypothetical protein
LEINGPTLRAFALNTTKCKDQVLFSKPMTRFDGPSFFKILGRMGVSLSPDSMAGSGSLLLSESMACSGGQALPAAML